MLKIKRKHEVSETKTTETKIILRNLKNKSQKMFKFLKESRSNGNIKQKEKQQQKL